MYDDSPRRGTDKPSFVQEEFSTLPFLQRCVFSRSSMMCEATQEFTNYITSSLAQMCKAMQEFTNYTISISALMCKKMKEMQQNCRQRADEAQ